MRVMNEFQKKYLFDKFGAELITSVIFRMINEEPVQTGSHFNPEARATGRNLKNEIYGHENGYGKIDQLIWFDKKESYTHLRIVLDLNNGQLSLCCLEGMPWAEIMDFMEYRNPDLCDLSHLSGEFLWGTFFEEEVKDYLYNRV